MLGIRYKSFPIPDSVVTCIVREQERSNSGPLVVNQYKRSIVEIDNPKETLQVLGNLAQRILEAEGISNEKRGLDLGLSRGFSGSQAAKHLMGLSAASFANGPGRKRRFADETQ
ncbi:diuretic hormone class 2 [Caerostris extrusa]|uniref:Diuretic hormone class 2 n=1 Tax=Caerostris extrusa TaxID=172846 RepID=A0AAV4Q0E2_CAEEX|nr:diuretic hormone class 2 [Caerostris extrusa]